MSIIPETLKAVRHKHGLSQQALADLTDGIPGGRVSKRTISRIENGETPPEKVRLRTVEGLAKALDVKADALCRSMNETTDIDWESRGYTRLTVLLPESARLNFRWVMANYRVQFSDLVEAAPWMFAILAEMSLAARRRRLEEARSSFEAVMDNLPSTLLDAGAARTAFDEACWNERDSLAKRDVFGAQLLESARWGEPFDPDETNPFADFLLGLIRDAGSDAIDPDDMSITSSGMPHWPVFGKWLDDLTGGDTWARFALERCRVDLSRMPEEVRGEENLPARIEWLAGHIPPEAREKEEARRLAAQRQKDELFGELDLS